MVWLQKKGWRVSFLPDRRVGRSHPACTPINNYFEDLNVLIKKLVSTDTQMDKEKMVHVYNGLFVIKRKEILPFTSTWMDGPERRYYAK